MNRGTALSGAIFKTIHKSKSFPLYNVGAIVGVEYFRHQSRQRPPAYTGHFRVGGNNLFGGNDLICKKHVLIAREIAVEKKTRVNSL
jgi:hypothetical protein